MVMNECPGPATLPLIARVHRGVPKNRIGHRAREQPKIKNSLARGSDELGNAGLQRGRGFAFGNCSVGGFGRKEVRQGGRELDGYKRR